MNQINQKQVNVLKWITGSIELFLGIPIVGGTIILSLAWIPLFVMMAFHVIILIIVLRNKHAFPVGNAIGLGASVLGFIPGLGMVLHLVAAVFIFMEAWQTHQALTETD